MAVKTKILDRVGFKDCDGLTSTAPEIPEETLSAGGKVRKLVAGLGNTEVERPKVNFLGQKGTKVVGNNSIYFYPGDMPGSITSGMGMVGADSETIDIVVGRMASAHGGEGPRDGMIVGNSFPNDAARIYISRFTKVDHYFGIDKRNTDPKDEVALSAIAMKADKVRIIGRYDINLSPPEPAGTGTWARADENSIVGVEKFHMVAGLSYLPAMLSSIRQYGIPEQCFFGAGGSLIYKEWLRATIC